MRAKRLTKSQSGKLTKQLRKRRAVISTSVKKNTIRSRRIVVHSERGYIVVRGYRSPDGVLSR